MPKLAIGTRNTASRRVRRPSLAMHSAQCNICRHAERAEIEREFLDWIAPGEIARDYNLGSRTSIYRHAHALGLFARRERSLRFALGRLIEQVGDVKPTAASIVSAIRLMAKLNARSEYVEEEEDSQPQDSPDVDEREAAAEFSDRSGNGALAETTEAGAGAPVAHAGGRTSTRVAPAHPEKRVASTGEDKAEKQDADGGYNGAPIAFAENVGPRRRFFWR